MRVMLQALALTLLLGGCDEGTPSPEPRTISHPQGWTIAVPADREGVEIATGFDIRQPNADSLRSPATITVRLAESGNANLPQRRRVGGIDVRYGIEEHSGGSGGTAYSLNAERPLCGDTLLVHQMIQREFGGTPAFADAWTVIASATCVPDR